MPTHRSLPNRRKLASSGLVLGAAVAVWHGMSCLMLLKCGSWVAMAKVVNMPADDVDAQQRSWLPPASQVCAPLFLLSHPCLSDKLCGGSIICRINTKPESFTSITGRQLFGPKPSDSCLGPNLVPRCEAARHSSHSVSLLPPDRCWFTSLQCD